MWAVKLFSKRNIETSFHIIENKIKIKCTTTEIRKYCLIILKNSKDKRLISDRENSTTEVDFERQIWNLRGLIKLKYSWKN